MSGVPATESLYFDMGVAKLSLQVTAEGSFLRFENFSDSFGQDPLQWKFSDNTKFDGCFEFDGRKSNEKEMRN